ncbi:MAG: D-tyrosyl-tRNA(Tyr) deacylase [Myxococcales bacterium]|nr:D-tyrosyl-tRNA(Tyr) deacylase [Myxococcales bacterium]
MRGVVQRVKSARVEVDGQITGRIEAGLLVLVGAGRGDTQADVDYLVDKTLTLRIFADALGKMNLDVRQIGGAVLAVSQFTLYGDARRGRRPGFHTACAPDEARRLYDLYCEGLAAKGVRCETGVFGAMMDVHLVNEGPVTLLLDSSRSF